MDDRVHSQGILGCKPRQPIAMTWKLVKGPDFRESGSAWDEINADRSSSPLLDSRFMLPLLAHFGTGHETLATYCDNEGTKAMAILEHPKPGLWSTIQPSQAPLGAWVTNRETQLPTIATNLLDELPGLPLVLGITQQDPAFTPRPQDSNRIRTLDYIRTARITVEGTFEDYWSARGKNLRQNLKRQRNRLAREGIKTKLEVITEPGAVSRAVAEYGRLESSGWKTAGGTAIHPENVQGRFYTDMLSRFASSDQCRIFSYYYNNQVVAMDLCIVGGGTLIILKTTYDESQTSSSPAMLMRQDAFGRIFEDKGIGAIEFYGKLMDWHTKWSDEVRTLYHLNCYRWGLLAGLHRRPSQRSTP